jgi:hypothetical protein
MDDCDQLMAGWDGFWPRRVRRASQFGSLPVGLWAAGPGWRMEMAMGQFSSMVQLNSEVLSLF